MRTVARSLNNLGRVALREEDYSQARALFEESLAVHRELGDRLNIAHLLNNLGLVAFLRGDFAAARSLYEENLAIKREIGDKQGIAGALYNLGRLAHKQGEDARADSLFRQSVVLFYEVGSQVGVAHLLEAFADLGVVRGDAVNATRLLGAAGMIREVIASPQTADSRADHERNLAALRAGLDADVFARAWAEGRALSLTDAIALALSESETPAPSRPALPDLRVFALGATRVYRGEHPVSSSEWTYAKARELLYYLLTHRAATKEQIGVALWPEASPAQLRSRFGVALHHLRRVLGGAEWIVFTDNRYAFNHALKERYWFDVEEFESTLAQVSAAMRAAPTPPAHLIAPLEQATQLYRGDFLQDWGEGEWHLLRREELRRKFLEALLTLGQLLMGERRYVEAAGVYRRVIGHDSFLEEAHRELLRCYARQGERGQALRHYQELVDLLRTELGSPPAAETSALYERLTRGQEI